VWRTTSRKKSLFWVWVPNVVAGNGSKKQTVLWKTRSKESSLEYAFLLGNPTCI
jgi:hypothetical protein